MAEEKAKLEAEEKAKMEREALISEAVELGVGAKSTISRWAQERLEEAVKQAKAAEKVEMWHQNRSYVIVPKEQVEAHLKAGWRLEK